MLDTTIDQTASTRAEDFYRLMLQTRMFEGFCSRLREEKMVLGNTYPCLGQEALGVAGLALEREDALFPSYRSRTIVFAKGATLEQHFRELIGDVGAEQAGREVFHHSAFPDVGIMPSSSMIGGWAPTAAGYALSQQLERKPNVTVCVIGDGSFGAGDVHEALNMIGVWRLPIVIMVENNGYQVSASWDRMRAQRAIAPYVAQYGIVTRQVDGNNVFDVYDAMLWARAEALAGRPAMLDCMTYRMGGYSSHFGEPRSGIDAELALWRRRDPIVALEDWLTTGAGYSSDDILGIQAGIEREIESAWERARAASSGLVTA